MVTPAILDTGPRLIERDVHSLEIALGAILPMDYRRFLLEYNGGRPEPPRFMGDNELHCFYGIHPRERYYDVLHETRALRGWLPREVIAIATAPTGDQLVLAVKGARRGKVYLWDHEGDSLDAGSWHALHHPSHGNSQGPDWPEHPDLMLIANSFTELLASFHDR